MIFDYAINADHLLSMTMTEFFRSKEIYGTFNRTIGEIACPDLTAGKSDKYFLEKMAGPLYECTVLYESGTSLTNKGGLRV